MHVAVVRLLYNSYIYIYIHTYILTYIWKGNSLMTTSFLTEVFLHEIYDVINAFTVLTNFVISASCEMLLESTQERVSITTTECLVL